MKKQNVLILVNSSDDGPFGIRAKGMVRYFENIDYKILYRKSKLSSMFRFLLSALTGRERVIYVINVAYSGIIAGLAAKLFLRKKLIIDIGDINYKLFKLIGKNFFICFLERALEYLALSCSDIIVRGKYFKDYLEARGYENVYYIPDGVDVDKFRPLDVSALKKKLAPNNELIVGIVGSLIWVKTLDLCYGWDLVEMLNILKKEHIRGVIIGDGTGKKKLEQRVKEYGIEDKVLFTGWLPYYKLPEYINSFDVCLSLQTNNLIGWLRTTAKLPLYLSCGKYVLATDVGGAHWLLLPHMRLEYRGERDFEYPERLARAVREILSDRSLLESASKNRDIALKNFDYRNLSRKLQGILVNM
ncbi:MAG: glycosyltransferase [Candidatus Omnitrophota bacterium]